MVYPAKGITLAEKCEVLNMSCGCSNGCSSNGFSGCWWIIILILLIVVCGDGFGNDSCNSCNCNCNCDCNCL
ncbi:MAG: hypothetical protein R3Y07_10645 [Eubacteriales bacterium]